ncbi:hypothetical protein PR202_gb12058 [Eleusine coracana subsp. coracana]|uniref:Uncharacterized protein n=1 Tax=Eleusine coracana subsp. coracana TaxID=191504 RepID=A0AAV5EPH9_ELECO|nr:hypothetical protein PR202_gb12058 [Eleusine coracana subsp. coracana]
MNHASSMHEGECHSSNWWLSFLLVTLLTLSCVFFSFTDSFVYWGKLRYGMAYPWGRGFILFNQQGNNRISRDEFSDELCIELKKRYATTADYVRAFFTAAVFLAFAAGDVGIQNCFFPQASFDAKQLLKNMPLGVAVLSSFVFMVCPTRRKGIDFLN